MSWAAGNFHRAGRSEVRSWQVLLACLPRFRWHSATSPPPVAHLQVGDRVKVLAGQHAGETGMLLSVATSEACIMLSDNTRQELRVFAR